MIEYFETNTSGEVSEQTVWEAHKAVIRLELIAHGSRVKKIKINKGDRKSVGRNT